MCSQADISAALTAYLGPNLPVSISYGPASSGNSGGPALAVSVQFPPNNQLSAMVTSPLCRCCGTLGSCIHVQLQ